jgi:hypothetical protein
MLCIDGICIENGIEALAGNDLTIKLGDNAGANKISFLDSDDVEIASLNSNGVWNIIDPGTSEYAIIGRNANTIQIDSGTGGTGIQLMIAGAEALNINATATVVVGDRIEPYHTASASPRDIGKSTKIWQNLYIEQVFFFDPTGAEYGSISRTLTDLDIDTGTGGVQIDLKVAGSSKLILYSWANFLCSIRPNVDSTYDIGENVTPYWFANAYVDVVHSAGINIYDDTHAENASITRTLDEFIVTTGTGSTSLKLQHGATVRQWITGAASLFQCDVRPWSDGSHECGVAGAYFSGGYFDHIYLGDDGVIEVKASVDVTLKLGDNAAANKLSITDSDDAEIFSIDSNGSVTIADAQNIILNTITGTKIGTAVGQKLGFWNATPVVQQAHIADPAACAAMTFSHSWDGATDPTAAEGNELVADLAALKTAIDANNVSIDDILAQLATLGLQASS